MARSTLLATNPRLHQRGGRVWRRIGEAKNLGPFSYGGASSSASGQSRLLEPVPATGQHGPVGASTARRSSFDDPDGWSCAEKESPEVWMDNELNSAAYARREHNLQQQVPGLQQASLGDDSGSLHTAQEVEAMASFVHEGGVVDDAEWNRYLDTICTARGSMSPEAVAYNWAMKQQQEQYQREWLQFEAELSPALEAPMQITDGGSKEMEVSQPRRLCRQAWTAPVETNQKKAQKWRSRMRVLKQADIIDPLLTEKERDTTAVDRSQEVVAPRNAPSP